MKLSELKIDTLKFYYMGIICFFIITLANTVSLILNYDNLLLSSKISSIAGIIFNLCIVLFFNYLRLQYINMNISVSYDRTKEINDYVSNLK